MSDNNLPIKIVLPRTSDIQKNLGGGKTKFFGEVTPELQSKTIEKFNDMLAYYKDVFEENERLPAVGKITVKNEAIAKSHKPNDLCKNCPIIGSEELNEVYIKVTQKGINDTIKLIQNLPSEKVKANLTVIEDIQPIMPQDKISNSVVEMCNSKKFEEIKGKIKIKIFNFDDDFDNAIIKDYINKKLKQIGLGNKVHEIIYGEHIEFLKIEVSSYEDIQKIAQINGVKFIDFFQEYSLPIENNISSDSKILLAEEYEMSDTIIGIIDGGISKNNKYLNEFIYERKEYVPEIYQNPTHATFIASTIQYGNILNEITNENKKKFRFLDIVAIPNSDKEFGETDGISEDDLMEIIEDVMKAYSEKVKIWNISLGIESFICNGVMSDLGIFCDYIQDKYKVQFIISSGNINKLPLRTWPPQGDMGERDRIISPADSVRAITVGSIALYESDKSIVKKNEPSPFSRRGPGANYIVKPDLVDYGGNLDSNYNIKGLGMKGLDIDGNIVEGNGTSYSTPRIVNKLADIYDELMEKDLLLAKAMLVHSARMNSREILDTDENNIKYYGFGMPAIECKDVLQCSNSEVTLVFKQRIVQGSHLEMYSFPFPKSLIRNGKYFGEIGMTLAYVPNLDSRYGQEYCRANIDVSFGVYKVEQDGKIDFKGQVPVEKNWDGKFEKAQVENGFKWSPIKSYYRKLSKGIQIGEGWKIRVDMNARSNLNIPSQDFVLIVTIKDPNGNDIYTEVVNGLRENGYITTNLETRYQVRQRQ